MAGGDTAPAGIEPSKHEALDAAAEERLPKWVLLSLAAHGVLIVLLLWASFWPWGEREPPPSYVVDLVGGERIGGRNLGTQLFPDSKSKVVSADPPAKTKSAQSERPVLPVDRKPTKTEKTPKIDKTEKTKTKTDSEIALDPSKAKAKQLAQRSASAPKEETKGHATDDEGSLDRVRERVIQAAIERARSRAAAAQASSTVRSDAAVEKAEPLSAGSGEGVGAQSLGKGGVGGEGVLKSIEYIKYVNYMQATLKANWAWAGPKRSLRALVRFGVKDNGEIVGIKIVQSSGDPLFDESVVRAVRKSSPLTAPPENHRKDFADVEYSFQPGQVG
jgi:TolA protein